MIDWLAAVAASGRLIHLGAGIAVFALVLAAGVAFAPREVPADRLRAAASGGRTRDGLGGVRQDPLARRLGARMRRILARLDLLKTRQLDHVVEAMAAAGWRSRDALVFYLFAKLTLPAAAGTVLATSLFLIAPGSASAAVRLALVLAAVLGASFLPDIAIRKAAAKRRRLIELGLPDAFDLLVICVESGSSLDAAIDRVGDEMGNAAPELADEFATAAIELRFLPERRQALDNLARRVDLPAVRALATTLVQTERFGTPLAQALRSLATELRSQRMLKAEERAGRLPALMTLPLVAFILPALFIVLMGPAILSLVRTFSHV